MERFEIRGGTPPFLGEPLKITDPIYLLKYTGKSPPRNSLFRNDTSKRRFSSIYSSAR